MAAKQIDKTPALTPEVLQSTTNCCFRIEAAQYRACYIQELLKNFQGCSRMDKFKTALEMERKLNFEMDAFILSLYSVFDLELQLINVVVLPKPLRPEDVTKTTILEHLKAANQRETGVQAWIKETWGNHKFGTLKAFSNTSKHREPLKGLLDIDLGETPPQINFELAPPADSKLKPLTPDDVPKLYNFVVSRHIELQRILGIPTQKKP